MELRGVSADGDSGTGWLVVTIDWWADAAVLPAEVSLASKKRTGTLQKQNCCFRFFLFWFVVSFVSFHSDVTHKETYIYTHTHWLTHI